MALIALISIFPIYFEIKRSIQKERVCVTIKHHGDMLTNLFNHPFSEQRGIVKSTRILN